MDYDADILNLITREGKINLSASTFETISLNKLCIVLPIFFYGEKGKDQTFCTQYPRAYGLLTATKGLTIPWEPLPKPLPSTKLILILTCTRHHGDYFFKSCFNMKRYRKNKKFLFFINKIKRIKVIIYYYNY
jgi:hypothetical protein